MKNCIDTRKWIGRGLLLAALAGTSVMTSCEYDDSDLLNRIEEVENRLSQLETKLNDEVKSLKQLLEGKATITSATKADGVWTIVLSTGETITVNEASADSVISVIEEEGTYYWALGGEKLLVDGKPVAVSGAAPSLRVDSITKEWMVSPDGGKTWMGTGIIGENAALFKKVEADDANVYFTLADGTELAIAKKGAESGFNLRFLAGKQYFDAGQSKTVAIDMTNVKKATIVGKPDGWKATLKEDKLTVTAPATGATGVEKEGSIAILAVSNDGKSDICELAVVQGISYFNLSAEGEAVTLKHRFAPDYWNYYGDYNGVMKLNDFSVDALKQLLDDTSRLKVDEKGYTNKSIKDLLAEQGQEVEKGVSYVVWAVPVHYLETGQGPKFEDLQYVVVTTQNIAFSATASFDEAQIKLTAIGVGNYLGGVSLKENFDAESMIDNINYFGVSDSGYARLTGSYEGPLSRYAMMWNTPNVLNPGKEYVVWALPIKSGDFTVDDLYTWEVALKTIEKGGTALATIGEVTSTVTSVEAKVTPSENTYKFYCEYLTADDMAKYETDDDLFNYLLMRPAKTAEYTVSRSGLSAGDKGWIVAVAVDAEGKAGELQKVEANAKEIVWTDTKIVGELIGDNSRAYLKVSTEGGEVAKYVYWWKAKSQFETDWVLKGDVEKLEKQMATMFDEMQYGYYAIEPANIPEEGIVIPAAGAYPNKLNNGEEYIVAAIGFDAEGQPTRLYHDFVTPNVTFEGKVIRTTAADYAKDMPVITSVELSGKSGYAKAHITVPEGVKCYVYTTDRETMPSLSDFASLTGKVIGEGTLMTESGVYTSTKYGYYTGQVFFVAWVDTDGNTHVCYDMKVFWGDYVTTDDGKPTVASVEGEKWTIQNGEGNQQCYVLATDKAVTDPYLLTVQVLRDGTALNGAVTVKDGMKVYAVWVDASGNTHEAKELTL